MALVERLAEERKIKGYNCQVIAAPKRSHASMGFIESMNDQAAKQIRVLKLQPEASLGVRVPAFHRIMSWLVRHAGWLLTRFAVRQSTGKTAFHLLRGKPYRGELATLGEVVWAREPGDRTQKAEAQWRLGVWLGKTEKTDEHLIGGPERTRRFRTIRRQPTEKRFDVQALNTFAGLPWDLDSQPNRDGDAMEKAWGGAEPHHGDNVAQARRARATGESQEAAQASGPSVGPLDAPQDPCLRQRWGGTPT